MVRNPFQGERLRELGIEVIVGDIRDPDAVRRAVQGVDVVHHCAAAVGLHYTGREVPETNLDGVRLRLEGGGEGKRGPGGAAQFGQRAGDCQPGPGDRGLALPAVARSWAADVKIEMERLALEVAHGPGPEVVILRPGFIYGPGGSRARPAAAGGTFQEVGQVIDELPDRGSRPVGDLVDLAVGPQSLGCQEHRLHDVTDMHDRDHVARLPM